MTRYYLIQHSYDDEFMARVVISAESDLDLTTTLADMLPEFKRLRPESVYVIATEIKP